MAKKDISKFQKALLSKTNIIKEEAKKSTGKSDAKGSTSLPFELDEKTLKKYKQLSKKHNIELSDLMNYGLKFFLEFEDELF